MYVWRQNLVPHRQNTLSRPWHVNDVWYSNTMPNCYRCAARWAVRRHFDRNDRVCRRGLQFYTLKVIRCRFWSFLFRRKTVTSVRLAGHKSVTGYSEPKFLRPFSVLRQIRTRSIEITRLYPRTHVSFRSSTSAVLAGPHGSTTTGTHSSKTLRSARSIHRENARDIYNFRVILPANEY